MKKRIIISLGLSLLLISTGVSIACTGFTASNDEKVLYGGNEDNSRPLYRHVEIIPPEEGKYGKIYFIYSGWGIQQIINDQGLLWDGFWAPHLDIYEGEGKPRPDTWIDRWMDVCSTVDEIIDIYNSYDWRDTGIEDGMLFFVDRYGNSAIIEGDKIIYKEGNYQVLTNFYQTHPELGGYGFDRYETAVSMLENMNELSMEYFKDICETTKQGHTIYSLVCDLTTNLIHYYYDGDFKDVWEINLNEEFELGQHSHDVLDVFNNNKPSKPNRPIGPHTGSANSTYEYSCIAIDIDGDQLYYKWDWGDGNISNCEM
jgi:hypothetical protein